MDSTSACFGGLGRPVMFIGLFQLHLWVLPGRPVHPVLDTAILYFLQDVQQPFLKRLFRLRHVKNALEFKEIRVIKMGLEP